MTDRLIYAALVAVWMAYLIPMGIRRYREVSAHGSIKSFSSSMRALGGSRSASETAPGGTPPGETVAARPATSQPAVAGVLDRASARQAAARRRRTLLVLLGLVAVTGALVVLTTLLWPAILVPIALVVGFLVVCRIQVARLEEAAWVRAAAAAKRSAASTSASRVRFDGCEEETLVISGPAAARLSSALGDVRTSVAPAAAVHRPLSTPASPREPLVAHGAHPASSADSERLVAHGAHPASSVDSEPLVAHGAHPAREAVSQAVVAGDAEIQPQAAAAAAHGASPAYVAPSRPGQTPPSGASPVASGAETVAPATWDLRPVTLPTYITKSRAPRTVRSVDRTGSDGWSSGRSNGQRPVRDEADGKPVQQRRAVGG